MNHKRQPGRRWAARCAGFGLTIAIALPLTLTEVDPAEAAGAVCFTVHGKCFCIDFFTTEARDMAWGELQNAIANTFYDFISEELDTEVRDYIGDIRTAKTLYEHKELAKVIAESMSGRTAYDMGLPPQAVTSPSSLLEQTPHLTDYLAEHPTHTEANTIRPKVEAIAYAMANPESLTPYKEGELNVDSPQIEPETLVLNKAWADRFITPAPATAIPSASELASTSTLELDRLHLTARQRAISAVAQNALVAPLTNDAELAGLQGQLEQIRDIQLRANPSVADMQTALVLADVIESEVLIRRIESHLRQERVMGSLVAIKQELAQEEVTR